ncbi:MAG: DegT/DnrJ/EryC1/StrS family aminotransferase [Bacteroidetes bacterium]|nr:DegT/DnrJ/EryC1/StrS family aminotransferase [Bacteroidota bacterium]
MDVPFFSLENQHKLIRKELEMAFGSVLDKERFILDSELKAFEKEFANYLGVKHCIGVANGLDALYVSLVVLGIKKGDSVLVPALTCSPTWIAVMRTGATTVPVDADPLTWQMNLELLEAGLALGARAIVPVHLFGRPENMSAISQLSERFGVPVVEDNAQAHGAAWEGKMTGTFGQINATSFYPTKNLGALGDGGAITTDDGNLAAMARKFANYGASSRFIHDEAGINSRLDELQAAFLRVKLRHLDSWNRERVHLAHLYLEQLKEVGDIFFPAHTSDSSPVHHLLVITTNHREKLRLFLESKGVSTDIHYPLPPHRQPFSPIAKIDLPVSERIFESALSLPLWPGLTEEAVYYVCENIRLFFRLRG